MEQYPRLLIISHNLYDETNNIGKTLVSLLSGWPADKLAQINFRNDIPSYKYCDKYYSIIDKDVALSVMTFGIHKAGRVLQKSKQNDASSTEKDLYRIGNKRIPLISLVRDTMWGIGTWKTKQLKEWVNQYDPEVILFVPNDYVLAYRVALFIEKKVKGVPLIPYYMDDAFYYDCETSGVDFLRRLQLRRKGKEIHTYASCIFTICEKMSHRYYEQFSKPCFDYMNSVRVTENTVRNTNNEKIIFSYIGNLHSNRWRCLADIGEALLKISLETEKCLELHIYSASDLGEKEKNILESIQCIKLMGSIPASEVSQKQRESDVLVHVEAFDKRSKNSTMYSLSTKIPEYMIAGVCVFAYGPSDIASLQYLRTNEVAFVCDKKEDLKSMLKSTITDHDKRERYIEKGIQLARERHDIKQVSNRFINAIIDYSKTGVKS